MIKSLNLKFGNAPNFPPVSVLTTPITVFVGPNNSGKSKVLAEINRFCTTGNTDPSDVIVDKIDFEPFHPEVVEEKIRQVTLKPNPGEFIQPDCVLVGKRGG